MTRKQGIQIRTYTNRLSRAFFSFYSTVRSNRHNLALRLNNPIGETSLTRIVVRDQIKMSIILWSRSNQRKQREVTAQHKSVERCAARSDLCAILKLSVSTGIRKKVLESVHCIFYLLENVNYLILSFGREYRQTKYLIDITENNEPNYKNSRACHTFIIFIL